MIDVPNNIDILDPFLLKLNKEYVSVEPDLPHNQDWLLVKDTVLKYLKKADGVFDQLFRKISYQGSTYENLKVGPRNEYDINLELKLADYYELEIEEGTNPGFARVRVGCLKTKQPSQQVKEKVAEWLNENKYLRTDKILNWFKSVVDKALKSMEAEEEHKIKICRRESGPAITLYIEYNNEFSVDMVLALPFVAEQMFKKQKDILKNMVKKVGQYSSRDIESRVWYLVPKKPKDSYVEEWRMSFYLYEKDIMNDLKAMKFVIRILKLLRDRRNWTSLKSYYIKTMFLWELEENEPKNFWSGKSNSYLFYYMLCRVNDYLDKKSIEYFWDHNCNLIKHLAEADTVQIQSFLTLTRNYISSRITKLENALRGQDKLKSIDGVLREMFNYEEAEAKYQNNAYIPSEEESSQNSYILPESYRYISRSRLNDPAPWKKQGIEEHEGLIEGLENGFSEPVNVLARRRLHHRSHSSIYHSRQTEENQIGGSILKWLSVGAVVVAAVGFIVALALWNTSSSIRRFQP